jgi:hypothetical protein
LLENRPPCAVCYNSTARVGCGVATLQPSGPVGAVEPSAHYVDRAGPFKLKGYTMSVDPFKDAPRHIGAVHSPMLADPTWIIGFRWMAGELLKAGRAATRHGSMPNYSTMLIETKWKPFLKGFAAHLWKVVQDGRNGPGFRAYVLNGDIVEAYELACAVLDESITVDGQKITLPSHPSENMLAALEDIVQMLSRWQAPPNEPEAASPPAAPREDEQPTTAPASGSTVKPPGDPAIRAVAAALALRKHGKPVSVRAACTAARVDRKNLAANHPQTIEFIEKLAEADRKPPSGKHDRRTGILDGREDPEDDDPEDD